MVSKTKEQAKFQADKFLYKLGQEHARKKILDLIDKRINNFKELNKKFPKNQTFVDIWTSLFELKHSIGEFNQDNHAQTLEEQNGHSLGTSSDSEEKGSEGEDEK